MKHEDQNTNSFMDFKLIYFKTVETLRAEDHVVTNERPHYIPALKKIKSRSFL